jgi:CheY-like chemotaxis protein
MNTEIMIVGNNPKSITYSGVLSGYGYRIAEAHTTGEAYSMLAAGAKPAAVILDLKFADLGDIIPALRTIGGDDVNIIVVGGDSGSAALKRGADVFLHQPIQPEDVLMAVHTGFVS